MSIVRDAFKVFILVVLFYSIVAYFSIRRAIESFDAQAIATMKESLHESSDRVRSFVEVRDFSGACSQLIAEQRMLRISLFSLIDGTTVKCSLPEGFSTFPKIENKKILPFKIKGLPISFIGGEVGNTIWIIGAPTPQRMDVKEYLSTSDVIRSAALNELLNVFYVCLMIIGIFVIMHASEIGRSLRSRPGLALLSPLFERLARLIQLSSLKRIGSATKALKGRYIALEKNFELLRTSLHTSIEKEVIDHSHKVPYNFPAVVARSDLNGFTKAIEQSNSAEEVYILTKIINEKGSELIQRYNGLFEKMVGDEITAVFRGDDADLRGFAFIRDLTEVFKYTGFDIGGGTKYLTLKGCICKSSLQFNMTPAGYEFSGHALSLSKRILDYFTDKDVSSIAVLGNDLSLIDPLAGNDRKADIFDCKLLGKWPGFFIRDFQTVQNALGTNYLNYFRSDTDVVFLLNCLKDCENDHYFKGILLVLRNIKVGHGTNEIVAAWKSAVDYFIGKKDEKNLAEIINVAMNLIPEAIWNQDLTSLLIGIDRTISDRLNSAIISVLSAKDIQAAGNLILPKDFTGEYRSTGDLLIARLKLDLSSKSLKAALRMLRSDDKRERDTGLYCSLIIIAHWNRKNPGAIETFSEHRAIVREILKIKGTESISEKLELLLIAAEL